MLIRVLGPLLSDSTFLVRLVVSKEILRVFIVLIVMECLWVHRSTVLLLLTHVLSYHKIFLVSSATTFIDSCQQPTVTSNP